MRSGADRNGKVLRIVRSPRGSRFGRARDAARQRWLRATLAGQCVRRDGVAERRTSGHARASLWMVALAMCAMIVVLAETLHVGAINVLPQDDGTFMQLAGPTPER